MYSFRLARVDVSEQDSAGVARPLRKGPGHADPGRFTKQSYPSQIYRPDPFVFPLVCICKQLASQRVVRSIQMLSLFLERFKPSTTPSGAGQAGVERGVVDHVDIIVQAGKIQ